MLSSMNEVYLTGCCWVLHGFSTAAEQDSPMSTGGELVPSTGSEGADGEANADDTTMHSGALTHSGILYTDIFSLG
jgi:hypothetical protein